MRSQRKSFRRKVFGTRKWSGEHKKKTREPRELDAQKDHPKERDDIWLWLSEEVADEGYRRLDRRRRRLNSELLRAVEEGAVEKVAR